MGLLDIAPPEILTKEFTIRGGTLSVRGIKNKEWIALLNRFPDIKKLLDGTGMNIVEVFESAVEGLIPALIAAGLGACGEETTEQLIKDRLSESEQYVIFEAIMDLGAVEKDEARKKINPLLKSPETGEIKLNGNPDPIPKMNMQQPSLL